MARRGKTIDTSGKYRNVNEAGGMPSSGALAAYLRSNRARRRAIFRRGDTCVARACRSTFAGDTSVAPTTHVATLLGVERQSREVDRRTTTYSDARGAPPAVAGFGPAG